MRMAMGRRESQQEHMWVAAQELPRSPGHVFYEKLNEVLEAGGFDRFVEELCAAHYAEDLGRPSIPPGVYFRMLFVGYFEGLDSQRAIAWRCADSLALRSFLRVDLSKGTPEHSSMTNTRKRLPEEVFWQVFAFVLQVAVEHKLLKGKTIAVDSTTLEANAAMKSLVRRATNEDWKTYVRRLMKAEGIDDPSDEEVRRFDRTRKKKTSNKEWVSATDPNSRVTKMKDGRTHLAYKAEHAVELGSGLIVAPVVYRGDDADAETLPVTVEVARQQLAAAGSPHQVDEVVGDKGYHKAETLQTLEEVEQVRAYIAEPKRRGRRVWQDKPEGQQQAVYANRQRIKGRRGRQLGRQRSEYAERSFAHTCETGGGRRAWLRGVMNVSKHHLMRAAACNLGIIMLALCGVGTPRTLQGGLGVVLVALLWLVWIAYSRRRARSASGASYRRRPSPIPPPATFRPKVAFSTGC
jgi:transposase